MLETIIAFAVQSLASYAVTKQLDKTFSGPTFKSRLTKIINDTIEEFDTKHTNPAERDKFPFYHSQIIIDEVLKFRLFSGVGHILDKERIQIELATNSSIIPPSPEELQEFLELFNKNVLSDDLLRNLEVSENYQQEIFNVSGKMDHLIGMVEPVLKSINSQTKGNYRREIEKCLNDIQAFKPQTAMDWLIELKKEFDDKQHEKNLLADIHNLIALCLELLGNSEEAWKNYTKAYTLNPDNIRYKEKAAFAYHYLKNDERALKLIDEIDNVDEYNDYVWFIKTAKHEKTAEFISHVPEIVLSSHRYQRLIYSWLRKRKNIELVKVLQSNNIIIEPDYVSLPEKITQENFFHWIFILSLTVNDYFFDKPIYFHRDSQTKDQSEYLHSLLKRLTDVILNSEIEGEYPYIIFYYRWFILQLSRSKDDVSLLIESYKSLDERDALTNLIYANTLQQNGRTDEAIKTLESDDQNVDSNTILLKCHCYLQIEDFIKFKETFLQYVESISSIDVFAVINLLNFIQILSSGDNEFSEIKEMLESKTFAIEVLEKLVKSYLSSVEEGSSESAIISEVEGYKAEIHDNYISLRKFIAQIYINIRRPELAHQYLNGWIDKTIESQELHQYIETLILTKKDQPELINLLEYWRINCIPLDDLFRKEIELRKAINDWRTIETIAEKGYKIMPDKQSYLYILIIALEINEKKEAIVRLLPEIEKFDFSKDNRGLQIAAILIRVKQYETGLELFYKLASDEGNASARSGFFTLSLHIPEGYFQSYDTIEIGRFVRYEYRGSKKNLIEITQDVLDANPKYNELLGKRVGEEIRISKEFSGEADTIRVLRITNKYLALHDDILFESENPLSAVPFEVVEFPDISDKEKFLSALIEKFGARGTQQKDQQESNFRKYYRYEISLSELTSFNFDRDYIKSFFSLTLPPTEGYLITPINYYKPIKDSENQEYILDIHTCLLFHQISKELDVKFNKDLFISNTVSQFLKNQIQKETHSPETEMSISITVEGVQPHVYQKGNKEKRIAFLMEFADWITQHTSERIPEKKLDLFAQMQPDDKVDEYLSLIIDNYILAQEDSCIVVTDDSFYFRRFPSKSGKIMSTEMFLINEFPNKSLDIKLYLSKQNYIGITPNKELLIESFNRRFNTADSYVFSNIIRSLSVGEEKTQALVNDTLEFIKYITVSSVLPIPEFEVLVTNIFVNLLRGILSVQSAQYIFQNIQKKFHLLPEQSIRVISCFRNAVFILTQK